MSVDDPALAQSNTPIGVQQSTGRSHLSDFTAASHWCWPGRNQAWAFKTVDQS
jgi:hypothetical protein